MLPANKWSGSYQHHGFGTHHGECTGVTCVPLRADGGRAPPGTEHTTLAAHDARGAVRSRDGSRFGVWICGWAGSAQCGTCKPTEATGWALLAGASAWHGPRGANNLEEACHGDAQIRALPTIRFWFSNARLMHRQCPYLCLRCHVTAVTRWTEPVHLANGRSLRGCRVYRDKGAGTA